MAGMDLFKQTSWMGSGFVQYANPIPKGPHAYGPPPYGVWPTSVEPPVQGNGGPIAPSDIAERAAAAEAREDDREKALFIEKKMGQSQAPVAPSAGADAAMALLRKPVDTTMLWGGIALAAVGLGTRIFAEEKTTTQALASGAAILGGAGLVYKALLG